MCVCRKVRAISRHSRSNIIHLFPTFLSIYISLFSPSAVMLWLFPAFLAADPSLSFPIRYLLLIFSLYFTFVDQLKLCFIICSSAFNYLSLFLDAKLVAVCVCVCLIAFAWTLIHVFFVITLYGCWMIFFLSCFFWILEVAYLSFSTATILLGAIFYLKDLNLISFASCLCCSMFRRYMFGLDLQIFCYP